MSSSDSPALSSALTDLLSSAACRSPLSLHVNPDLPMSPSASQLLSSGSDRRGKWTTEEDARLKEAVELFEGKNWKKIASHAFGELKSDVQCLHRWQKVLRPGLVKGAWTNEEDALVTKLVGELGLKKWSLIASQLNGRLGKQCRERWFNHLNPLIKKDNWTPEEDEVRPNKHEKSS
jgi:myb proto-oncogene protein